MLASIVPARLIYLDRIGRRRHVAMGWLWKGAAVFVLTGRIVPLERAASS